MAEGTRAGEVTHYFNEIQVAVIRLTHELAVGDSVHFLGSHTDFRQTIDSMQVEHEAIDRAEAGAEVAVKVEARVRVGDSVFVLAAAD